MATNKVGTKKSLFKKPAWAATKTSNADNSDDDTPIFGQGHYSEIVEAEKARKERHAAKLRQRAEKERQQEEQREVKRRRISKEAEDSDVGSDSDVKSAGTASQSSPRSVTPALPDTENAEQTTPQKLRGKSKSTARPARSPHTRSQTKQLAQDNVTGIDSETGSPSQADQEDDDLLVVSSNKLYPGQSLSSNEPEPDPESEEEDEYLRELKAKARREARLNKLGVNPVEGRGTVVPSSKVLSESGSPAEPGSRSPTRDQGRQQSRETSMATIDNEPEVRIWIKTVIPGAREVIVGRKISQPLDKVRDFWIKRNELDPSIAEKVFFTWNGIRLYDSTTMRSIIERVKKKHPRDDGGDASDGRIVIEAVTDEIFEYMQKQRARQLAGDENGDDGSPSQGLETGVANEPDANTAPKAGIVIRLKAQGMEEMNLRVRPSTTMAKILGGFCRVKNVDSNMQKWLSYDGEKLDEDATVEEVGFEHEDTVDVYLR